MDPKTFAKKAMACELDGRINIACCDEVRDPNQDSGISFVYFMQNMNAYNEIPNCCFGNYGPSIENCGTMLRLH